MLVEHAQLQQTVPEAPHRESHRHAGPHIPGRGHCLLQSEVLQVVCTALKQQQQPAGRGSKVIKGRAQCQKWGGGTPCGPTLGPTVPSCHAIGRLWLWGTGPGAMDLEHLRNALPVQVQTQSKSHFFREAP